MSDITPFTFPTTGQSVRTLLLDGEAAIKGFESHLYVVDFGGYGIKVGITADPARRLMAHQRNGYAFGRPATCGWITEAHVEAQANEGALIAFCKQEARTCTAKRTEYFNVPFDVAIKFAGKLPRSRGDREVFDTRCSAALAGLLMATGWSQDAANHIANYGRAEQGAAIEGVSL